MVSNNKPKKKVSKANQFPKNVHRVRHALLLLKHGMTLAKIYRLAEHTKLYIVKHTLLTKKFPYLRAQYKKGNILPYQTRFPWIFILQMLLLVIPLLELVVMGTALQEH